MIKETLYWLPSKPHARGDESSEVEWQRVQANVSPTHVGMNRLQLIMPRWCMRKPHARGDEPDGRNR